MTTEPALNRQKLGILKVFSDEPIPLSRLTRIASQKVKLKYDTNTYIEILDIHFFEEYKVYAVLFEVPSGSEATCESSVGNYER